MHQVVWEHKHILICELGLTPTPYPIDLSGTVSSIIWRVSYWESSDKQRGKDTAEMARMNFDVCARPKDMAEAGMDPGKSCESGRPTHFLHIDVWTRAVCPKDRIKRRCWEWKWNRRNCVGTRTSPTNRTLSKVLERGQGNPGETIISEGPAIERRGLSLRRHTQ
jgi:hypothetical protein